ncbi:MAG: type I methionyl aminopeptidase [Desulfobulbaceae bacterium]|nr:type I methionyl aminopeptidase [Desulfobulbaceae bacterium]MCK5543714.1 type I methionyl aminopeptidase [Desulfobulbaceae bacterium]
MSANMKKLYAHKYNIHLKNKADVEHIRRAGSLVVETLRMVESEIRPGITTDTINTLIHEFTVAHKAIPAPLHYNMFPKSACISVNEVICHGIPGERILQNGDIVNVDVTSILNGYYADANKTFFVGSPGSDSRKIVRVAGESLKTGLAVVRPGNTIGDIGWAIQRYAEGQGCSVVREFCGHGVGFKFHEAPLVPHFGCRGEGVSLVPGMVFTIEPMINLGKRDLRILEDNWTTVTQDGSLSAQFEQTVLVTDNGFESLTPYELGGCLC